MGEVRCCQDVSSKIRMPMTGCCMHWCWCREVCLKWCGFYLPRCLCVIFGVAIYRHLLVLLKAVVSYWKQPNPSSIATMKLSQKLSDWIYVSSDAVFALYRVGY